MADCLITRVEATRLSGLNKKTIARRVKEGVIASVTPSGSARSKVSKNSLDDFMAFIWPTDKATQRRRRVGRTNADPTAHAWLYGIHDPKDGQCIYVGYTGQTRYEDRWQQHRTSLKAGRHHNRQLQSVYNKRGKPFGFKIITDGMSALMLDGEKRAIAGLRAKIGNRLCNATSGGEGTPGMSQSTRERIAAISRAKWQDPEYRKKWAKATGRSVKGVQPTSDRLLAMWVKMCNVAIKDYNMRLHARRVSERYTTDDLVWPTLGKEAFVPLTKGLWGAIPRDRVAWAKRYRTWAAAKMTGGKHKITTKVTANVRIAMPRPWRILGQAPPRPRAFVGLDHIPPGRPSGGNRT